MIECDGIIIFSLNSKKIFCNIGKFNCKIGVLLSCLKYFNATGLEENVRYFFQYLHIPLYTNQMATTGLSLMIMENHLSQRDGHIPRSHCDPICKAIFKGMAHQGSIARA